MTERDRIEISLDELSARDAAPVPPTTDARIRSGDILQVGSTQISHSEP